MKRKKTGLQICITIPSFLHPSIHPSIDTLTTNHYLIQSQPSFLKVCSPLTSLLTPFLVGIEDGGARASYTPLVFHNQLLCIISSSLSAMFQTDGLT